MNKRLGFVGLILEDRRRSSEAVNHILSGHGDHIVGRMGVPYASRHCSVIALIVDMTTDELGTLTGQLGMLKGVTVQSALAKTTRGETPG